MAHLKKILILCLIVTSVQAQNSSPVSRRGGARANLMLDSLAAYWAFDESSGNAADATGNGNTLTNNNGATFVAGLQSNCARLDSSINYNFSVASNAYVQGGDVDFTFAVWFMKKEFVPDGDNFGDAWIAKNSAASIEYRFSNIAATLQRVVTYNGSTTISGSASYTSTALDTTTWNLVIGWHSGDSTYIQFNNNIYVAALDATTPGVGDAAFRIGGTTGTSATTYATGLVDEVAFWHRVLTPTERTWLYNAGSGRIYSEFE